MERKRRKTVVVGRDVLVRESPILLHYAFPYFCTVTDKTEIERIQREEADLFRVLPSPHPPDGPKIVFSCGHFEVVAADLAEAQTMVRANFEAARHELPNPETAQLIYEAPVVGAYLPAVRERVRRLTAQINEKVFREMGML